jgi:hypothetical protein
MQGPLYAYLPQRNAARGRCLPSCELSHREERAALERLWVPAAAVMQSDME